MPSKKRNRFRDRSQLATSDRTAYRDDWKSRHAARKNKARQSEINAGIAFASIGGWLAISNDGHHWRIYFATGSPRFVEWWPSSAKLVIDRQYQRGIHCHRWQDAFNCVRKTMRHGRVK